MIIKKNYIFNRNSFVTFLRLTSNQQDVPKMWDCIYISLFVKRQLNRLFFISIKI